MCTLIQYSHQSIASGSNANNARSSGERAAASGGRDAGSLRRLFVRCAGTCAHTGRAFHGANGRARETPAIWRSSRRREECFSISSAFSSMLIRAIRIRPGNGFRATHLLNNRCTDAPGKCSPWAACGPGCASNCLEQFSRTCGVENLAECRFP